MPNYTLMDHQKKAVLFIRKMKGVAALLFDPGVGKTGSTLAWVDRQVATYTEMRVLVIAPLTATDTWVLQVPDFMDSPTKARVLHGQATPALLKKLAAAHDWTNVPKTKIMLDHPGSLKKQIAGHKVTIMSMSSGAISSFCKDRTKTVQMLRAVRKFQPHLIVVDESHLIKAHDSNVSKAMYQMGQIAKHRIILTGTVNPNGPLDCYGQWRFLAPWTFSDQYGKPYTADPTTMTKAEIMEVKPWPWTRMLSTYTVPGGYGGKGIGGYINLTDLHNRVAERSMVVKKEDALTLPPTSDIDVHFSLSPREMKAYDEMREELATMLDSGELLEAPNPLSKMMKLRQIHAGFVRDTETDTVHMLGTSLQDAVEEVVNVRLAGEKRVVVFAYFQWECTELARRLAAQPGQTVRVVTGKVKGTDRLAIRQEFGDLKGHPERIILVAQARTMSISVNELVTASHAVYASLSERRDDRVQSRGRLDRKGQTRPVTFWNVMAKGLVGEIMRDSQIHKGDLETSLFDHIKAVRK